MDGEDDQLRLAGPQLALDLLGTVRYDGDTLVDYLADTVRARAWLRRYTQRTLSAAAVAEIVRLRDEVLALCTAVVNGQPPSAAAVRAVNRAAAQSPVTLAARWSATTLHVERVVTGPAAPSALRAEFARSALALLAEEYRGLLGRCHAPSCVLFFLRHHPRQQWCSTSCGNRARVARHYARHRQQRH